MKKLTAFCFFAASVVAVLAPMQIAHATPLQWTLDNFTFSDGGTAMGSFIYDADTNTYSSRLPRYIPKVHRKRPAAYEILRV
jgi:hypothetical protein